MNNGSLAALGDWFESNIGSILAMRQNKSFLFNALFNCRQVWSCHTFFILNKSGKEIMSRSENGSGGSERRVLGK